MAITTEGSGEPHDGPAGSGSGPSPAAGAGEPHDGPAGSGSGPSPARGFDSTSPATGEVVGSFPLDGPEQVAAAVARAREAQPGWAELGFDSRRRALQAYKALLVRRTDELVDLVHRENGKPHADALMEVVLIASTSTGRPATRPGCWGGAGPAAPCCWPTTPPRSSTGRSGWWG
jgi:hypothetical protein